MKTSTYFNSEVQANGWRFWFKSARVARQFATARRRKGKIVHGPDRVDDGNDDLRDGPEWTVWVSRTKAVAFAPVVIQLTDTSAADSRNRFILDGLVMDSSVELSDLEVGDHLIVTARTTVAGNRRVMLKQVRGKNGCQGDSQCTRRPNSSGFCPEHR
jgi:hypothetical protein